MNADEIFDEILADPIQKVAGELSRHIVCLGSLPRTESPDDGGLRCICGESFPKPVDETTRPYGAFYRHLAERAIAMQQTDWVAFSQKYLEK